MDNQRSSDRLFPSPFNQQRLISGLASGLLTLCLTANVFAQSYSPAAIPAVPDARKPGRNIQPSQPSSTQPPAAQPPATPPAAQPPATPPVAPATTWSNEGLFSQSTQFAFQLQPANHPQMPSIDQLMETSVTLYQTTSPNGMRYSGNALANAASVKLTLAELAATKGSLTDSARVVIQKAVVATVNAGGVNGVACIMDAAPTADTPNTVNVVVAQVGSVRTVTSGVRTDSKEESVNDARQATIKEESPIQEGDLLEKTVLDDYLYSLSRFPGRTVSAAVTSEPSSAQVVLDYYVQEKNVFDVFASVSNTGTEQTNYWQQRVGILATQLSNNDDILAIEYQTASFTQTQSASGYYDARVGTMQNLRWRVTGNWGNYNSSDVGLAGEDFNGSNWGFQGDLIWTFYQKQNFFLDFDGSGRVWNSYTNNELFQTTGDANFVTVSGTFDALALGDTWAIQGSLGASYTATNADQESLDNLGRTDTSTNWTTINGSVYGSIYMDPWFDSAWGKNTGMYKPLVHELFGSLRGQYAFDYRLTPLSQYTMGGLYTVRGFATSINAGDSALVGTVEYRMHLPRMFAATTPTSKFPFVDRPFRWAPDSSNGASPDWDLVLSTFFDGGTISNSNAFEFEVNTPMYSAGVGLDLSILDNISIGVDWAWALNSIDQLDVQSGSSQFWFSASFVY
ncbi:MAG: ShlB/FhaC/HecB family hemolysin secretion/activation protein [Phycisphaerales bacterium]